MQSESQLINGDKNCIMYNNFNTTVKVLFKVVLDEAVACNASGHCCHTEQHFKLFWHTI